MMRSGADSGGGLDSRARESGTRPRSDLDDENGHLRILYLNRDSVFLFLKLFSSKKRVSVIRQPPRTRHDHRDYERDDARDRSRTPQTLVPLFLVLSGAIQHFCAARRASLERRRRRAPRRSPRVRLGRRRESPCRRTRRGAGARPARLDRESQSLFFPFFPSPRRTDVVFRHGAFAERSSVRRRLFRVRSDSDRTSRNRKKRSLFGSAVPAVRPRVSQNAWFRSRFRSRRRRFATHRECPPLPPRRGGGVQIRNRRVSQKMPRVEAPPSGGGGGGGS